MENLPPGFTVVQVSAFDEDSVRKLTLKSISFWFRYGEASWYKTTKNIYFLSQTTTLFGILISVLFRFKMFLKLNILYG